MNHPFSSHPTPEDHARIIEQLPFLDISSTLFRIKEPDLKGFMKNQEIDHWVTVLFDRINDAEMSYVFATFYYEKGIPDDPFHSVSDDGSQKLFPLFKDGDVYIKWMFDYYTDTYFYKAFSSLDTLAHLLFNIFDLETQGNEKISFKTVIWKLKPVSLALHERLLELKNSSTFKEADRIRNDHTHNTPHSTLDSGVRRTGKMISFGIFSYTNAEQMHNTMLKMHACLIEIIKVVAEELNNNHPLNK